MFSKKINKLIRKNFQDKPNVFLTPVGQIRLISKKNYSKEEILSIESDLNLNINKNSKKFKKLIKEISLKRNLKYQEIFNIDNANIVIEKNKNVINISSNIQSPIFKSKLLKKLINNSININVKEFEKVYPKINILKKLGINILFNKGEAKAKVNIFPEIENSFFSKEDIFARRIVVGDQILNFNQLKELFQNKKDFVFIGDTFVKFDKRFLNELEEPESLNYIELLREHISNNNIIAPQLNEYLLEKLAFQKIDMPEMKLVTLDDYQKDGVEWIANNCLNGLGSILADDMGLGKTLQTITAIQYLKERLNDIKVLIIVPTAILLNWRYEISTFSTLTSSFYYGPNKKIFNTDIVLTSYGTVTYDNLLADQDWDLVIIDEAQKIKNYQSIIANKVNLINAKSRIALTGTPVENNLMDLWSIFNFVNPGYLGNEAEFKAKFSTKIVDLEKTDLLKKIISPFILRREKSILPIQLPNKNIQNININLTEEQNYIYNQIVESALLEIESLPPTEKKRRFGIILATITKLKQICNHPGNYSEELMHLESSKLNVLKEIVKNVIEKKEKIIIFTQYVKMINILNNELDKVAVFHGGLNLNQRMDVLDSFKTDSKNILIISLKAGGTGLNIVEANHVLHYDLWFNPAVENQATDRAHRRGQLKEVFVYRFISKGTFEEKINNMLISKQDLFNSVIRGSEISYFSKMDNSELKKLFSLNEID